MAILEPAALGVYAPPYTGGYTAVQAYVRGVRPAASPAFKRRFETPPGRQA
ncbi:transposase [Roseospira marina]|nr:transposase [Roseospira marina]MBB5089395.1 transposase [Roseospira marina]